MNIQRDRDTYRSVRESERTLQICADVGSPSSTVVITRNIAVTNDYPNGNPDETRIGTTNESAQHSRTNVRLRIHVEFQASFFDPITAA